MKGRSMDTSKKIYVIGDIDEDQYRQFAERMDECEETLEGDDVTVELSSHGGDALVALAFYDRIRRFKGNVKIEAFGPVMSAAVLILAAGDERHMGKSAWVMVHEDSVILDEEPRVSAVEKTAKISRTLETQWNKLLESRTKVSASTWEKLHAEETYLDAKACLALGLIDKVI